jgi:hypothetical protein
VTHKANHKRNNDQPPVPGDMAEWADPDEKDRQRPITKKTRLFVEVDVDLSKPSWKWRAVDGLTAAIHSVLIATEPGGNITKLNRSDATQDHIGEWVIE